MRNLFWTILSLTLALMMALIPTMTLAEGTDDAAADLLSRAESGDAQAQMEYANSLKDAGDYEHALTWYEQVYNGGSDYAAEAANNLGWLYDSDDNGIAKDYQKANDWFEESALLGFSQSMTHIGMHYAHGKGYEKDAALAIIWYNKAIDAAKTAMEYAYAYGQLGALYADADSDVYDIEAAIQWYELAIIKGAYAFNWDLARLYDMDAAKDPAKAVIFYQRYIDTKDTAHHGEALWRCGWVMAYLLDMKTDGFDYFRQSAEYGEPDGMYYYGEALEIYLNNPEAAMEWYRKGAEAGSKLAQAKLESIDEQSEANP